MSSFTLLNWNVRGLNDPARRCGVNSLVLQSRCSVLCLQETKVAAFSAAALLEVTGRGLAGHALLPAIGTRGGILLAWDTDVFDVDQLELTGHAISEYFSPRDGGTPWQLTTVYGPCNDADKLLFLEELVALRERRRGPWLVLGDFNLIYEARDKSNSNLNHIMMAKFRAMLNAGELREISLHGRHFTWSNEQGDPTLCLLDRAFL